MSIYDLQTELKGYQKEFPYRIIYNKTGDLAAIRFKGLLWPLFLRQTPEGFWKLDITKGWAFSQANYNLTGMYPLYRDHPWMFAYTDYPYEKSRCNIPKLIPFPLNIKSRIEELQDAIRKDPGNASNYFKLADIFYWECFWVRAAIDVVEKGLKLEPDNVPYRWLVIYMLYRYPKIEDIPAHYKALLKLNPCDDDTLYRCTSHYSDLLKQPSKAKMIRIKYKTRCLLHTIDVTPVLIVLLLPGVVVIVMVVVVVLIVKRISSSTSQSGVENKHSQQQ
jgi:tetratricopeptide (TPR) repeat protein